MFFSRSRLARLLPGLLAPLLVGSAARAQIHEEKPLPSLEEGVLLEVDGRALANPSPLKQALGEKDFSIVVELATQDLSDTVLYADGDRTGGWSLRIKADGAVEFSGRGTVAFATPAQAVKPRSRASIVASIKRDARQPLAGIWVDGIERASGAVPPIAVGGVEAGPCEAAKLAAIHLRVYNRALTRPEILELQLRSSRREEARASASAASSHAPLSTTPQAGSDSPKPKHPAPPPNGPRFIPQPGETIALIGGTEAVALAESGELEALLLLAFPETKFHFRSLAWEGDTVFKQDRPMNFGSLEQQLRRVNAGAVFVMFGRQECLDAAVGNPGSAAIPGGSGKNTAGKDAGAPGGLEKFKTAFGRLLDTVTKVTPNLVVIGPPPFEKKAPPLPDLSGANTTLARYNDALREVAEGHAAAFEDIRWIFDAKLEGREIGGWTSDGAALTARGVHLVAECLTGKFITPPLPDRPLTTINLENGPDSKSLPALTSAIRAKNRLWHHYWRPSNWAFLHGDRTNQPSSRDPVNPQIRVFPAEQEKYLPLIKDAEERIYQLVDETRKKLP